MGKRKTRRRYSRRSKKGGYHAKAGNEICIWTNKGARRCEKVKEDREFAQKIYPIGITTGWWPKHDNKVNYPLSRLTNYVPNMNLEIVSEDNLQQLMDKKTPLYIVLHEQYSSKIDGPRYGLYKHPNCKISMGENEEYNYTLENPLWKDKLHFNIGSNNVVSGKWGKTVANEVGTLMFQGKDNDHSANTDDYDSEDTEYYEEEGYGGGKRKKKRRKRTKKKSRKKRKRTKKRRRRRR